VLPQAARLLGPLEPALERVVYQDIPANLLALKHRVETRKAAQRVAELESQGKNVWLTTSDPHSCGESQAVGCAQSGTSTDPHASLLAMVCMICNGMSLMLLPTVESFLLTL
jgi:hypothetical protein